MEARSYYDAHARNIMASHNTVMQKIRLNAQAAATAEAPRSCSLGKCAVDGLWNINVNADADADADAGEGEGEDEDEDATVTVRDYEKPLTYPRSACVHVDDRGRVTSIDFRFNDGMFSSSEVAYKYVTDGGVVDVVWAEADTE